MADCSQDFARIYTSLGLGKGESFDHTRSARRGLGGRTEVLTLTAETIASLQAFRKRHADAQRIHAQLAAQPTTVDLEHYRSVLRNKAVVDEAEKILRDFKPVTYDVNSHIKAIETFEAKAVSPQTFELRGVWWRQVKGRNVLMNWKTGREGEGDYGENRR